MEEHQHGFIWFNRLMSSCPSAYAPCYLEHLVKITASQACLSAFQFFESIFLELNVGKGTLERSKDSSTGLRVCSRELLSMDTLWRYATDAANGEVAEAARLLLSRLYCSPSGASVADASELGREAFVRTCLRLLEEFLTSYSAGDKGAQLQLQRIERCLSLLQSCLDSHKERECCRIASSSGPRAPSHAQCLDTCGTGQSITVLVVLFPRNERVPVTLNIEDTVGELRHRLAANLQGLQGKAAAEQCVDVDVEDGDALVVPQSLPPVDPHHFRFIWSGNFLHDDSKKLSQVGLKNNVVLFVLDAFAFCSPPPLLFLMWFTPTVHLFAPPC